jgi:hypothetical protein
MAKGQLRSNREKKKKPKADKNKKKAAPIVAVYAGVAYRTEDRRQEILVIVLLGSTVRDAFPAHCSSRRGLDAHNRLFRLRRKAWRLMPRNGKRKREDRR